VPDSQWGEALKAVVVLKEGSKVDSEGLMQFCKERLSSYKVPKSVAFVLSLPHTEVGKVNKVKVREMILADAGGLA
ncbi:MAG: long-chain fatty acid--CoA ligase, partial [Candidatus Binatia bacterium]